MPDQTLDSGTVIDGITLMSGGGSVASGVWTAARMEFTLPGSKFNAGASQVEAIAHIDLSGWKDVVFELRWGEFEFKWGGGYANTFYSTNNFRACYPSQPFGGEGVSVESPGHLDSGPVILRWVTDLTIGVTSIYVDDVHVTTSAVGSAFDPTAFNHLVLIQMNYAPLVTRIEIRDDTGAPAPPAFWTGFSNTYERV